ncbi:MAG: response regulator [Myxococcales bacterium]|nr:response regulator [Myxococcales bacterium]MCB9581350.1 response regulator [Polyangiaceae bacterium]
MPDPTQKVRVLVIDDEPMIRTMMARLLRKHEVTVTDGGKAALAELEAGRRFDLILCDVSMPLMTGIELFITLKEHYPEQAARVVMMTGGVTDAKARAFLENGVPRWVEKPCSAALLRELVEKATEQPA